MQADAEHRQRPDIADKGDAEGRHRDFEPAAGEGRAQARLSTVFS
jgi:hypothetical protein